MKNFIQIALILATFGFALVGLYSFPDFLRSKNVHFVEIKNAIICFSISLVCLTTALGHKKNGRWNKPLLLFFFISIGICVYFFISNKNFNYFLPILGGGIIILTLVGGSNLILKSNDKTK